MLHVDTNQKRGSSGTIRCNLLLSTCLLQVCTSQRITISTIIWLFASMGDIVLLWDFNAQIKNEHTTISDMSEAIEGDKYGRTSWYNARSSRYKWSNKIWQKLLALGIAHGFVIYNGLSQWPRFNALTFRNPKWGAGIVDYLMDSPSSIHEIIQFTTSSRPIGLATDHTHLWFEVKDRCTRDIYARKESRLTVDVYSCWIYNGILALDPFAPLDEVT